MRVLDTCGRYCESVVPPMAASAGLGRSAELAELAGESMASSWL